MCTGYINLLIVALYSMHWRSIGNTYSAVDLHRRLAVEYVECRLGVLKFLLDFRDKDKRILGRCHGFTSHVGRNGELSAMEYH